MARIVVSVALAALASAAIVALTGLPAGVSLHSVASVSSAGAGLLYCLVGVLS